MVKFCLSVDTVTTLKPIIFKTEIQPQDLEFYARGKWIWLQLSAQFSRLPSLERPEPTFWFQWYFQLPSYHVVCPLLSIKPRTISEEGVKELAWLWGCIGCKSGPTSELQRDFLRVEQGGLCQEWSRFPHVGNLRNRESIRARNEPQVWTPSPML